MSIDFKEQIVSEALCRNHLSGFAEVCAGVCGDSTVSGQPHPCEHALTVWRSDAQEILRALLARVDPKALEELDLASRAIERARALLASSPSAAVRDAPLRAILAKLGKMLLASHSLNSGMEDQRNTAVQVVQGYILELNREISALLSPLPPPEGGKP